MIIHRERYTLMRRHIKSGKIEEGLSSDSMKVMNNLLRAAAVEDVDWVCWIKENRIGITKYEEVFLQ